MNIDLYLYIIIFVAAFAFKVIEQSHIALNARKHYVVLICIILASVSALRGLYVGPDTHAYSLWFEKIGNESWDVLLQSIPEAYKYGNERDPGFPILTKAFHLLSSDFRWFLVAIAIPFFSALGIFVYKNTTNLRDAVFAFVLYVALFQIIALSGIRQQITTAIALFALEYIKRNELTRFLFLIILGSTIHISLLLIVPLYFLPKLKTAYIKYVYLLPIVFFYLIVSLGPEIMTTMASAIRSEYYMVYTQPTGRGGGFVYISMAVIVALFGSINMSKILHKSKQNKIYYTAIGLMLFFVPLILIDGTLIRVGQYFSLYMMVFVPLVVNNLQVELKYRYAVFFILCATLIFLDLRSPTYYYFFWQ